MPLNTNEIAWDVKPTKINQNNIIWDEQNGIIWDDQEPVSEPSLVDKGIALAGQGIDFVKGLAQTPTDQPYDDTDMMGTGIPEGVKQLPSAVAIGEMAKDLYTGKPLPKGAGYLQKPMGWLADKLNKVWTAEDEKKFRAKNPNLAAAGYALSSVMLPGVGEKFYSPEERERFVKQPKAAQELELLGLTASYVAAGAIMKWGKEGAMALANRFPVLTKPIGETILKSGWFKKLNIKMRGKTLNTAEKMHKAGMTDAEIARKLMKEQKMSGLEIEKELEAMKGIKRKTPEEGTRLQIKEKPKEVKAKPKEEAKAEEKEAPKEAKPLEEKQKEAPKADKPKEEAKPAEEAK